jgi:DNA-directed RNA polymerase specialized sigma24 family protein
MNAQVSVKSIETSTIDTPNPHVSSLITATWMLDRSLAAASQARAARRDAIAHLRGDGWTYRAIAAAGGISTSAAWSAVHRDAR